MSKYQLDIGQKFVSMKLIYNTDRLGVRCITDWLSNRHNTFAEKPPAEPDAVNTDAGKSELMLSFCNGRAEMPYYYHYSLAAFYRLEYGG